MAKIPQIDNWENVSTESKGFNEMPADGYVCDIVNVDYVEYDPLTDRGNYLTFEVDVVEGEFKDYARNTYNRAGFWPLTFSISCKPSVAWKYKKFIKAINESNTDFKGEWDSDNFETMQIGVVMSKEEYKKNNGDIGQRFSRWDAEFVSTEDIRKGNFTVKPLKKIELETFNSFDDVAKAVANPFAK